MGDVLAFIEQRDGSFRGVAGEVVSTAARLAEGLGGSAHALALGGGGLSDGADSLGRFGASKVRVAEHEDLERYGAEAYARVVADAARSGGYDAILFVASAQGKDLAPRVAALLDVPLAADVTSLDASEGRLAIVRPIYAGKAFASVEIDASPAVVSIRPNVFGAEEGGGTAEVDVFVPELDPGAPAARFVRFESEGAGAVDVAEAAVVVAGGRGMKDPENWGLLEELRDALGDGTALGASRAVVDAGWRPHGEQVGQTGKTVAPKLYFAIGISGAIQHLAGMRTAGTIVAVNKDPDAPIFNVADYGIVGDLFEVVPRLTAEIRELRYSG
ncbi:MAG: electron transfer flavoprotein subunit alpha/FixB family protein [Gemmatimonadota bacterium]|jgi:electron transfer flavoprotein alpha subunit